MATEATTLSWPSGDLSLPEFGALTMLATDGPQLVESIRRLLGVSVSLHRLVNRGLVVRTSSASDVPKQVAMLSTGGRRIVEHLLAHRRDEIEIVRAGGIGGVATVIGRALAQLTAPAHEVNTRTGREPRRECRPILACS